MEARAARHEAYRVGFATRRAAEWLPRQLAIWHGGTRYHRPSPQSARMVFALLRAVHLLGVMAVLLPGFGGPASPLRAWRRVSLC